jgi:hypothetical protein
MLDITEHIIFYIVKKISNEIVIRRKILFENMVI